MNHHSSENVDSLENPLAQSSTCIQALELLADHIRVHFHPLNTREFLTQAIHNHPGTWEEHWFTWMAHTAKNIGLRLLTIPEQEAEHYLHSFTGQPFVTLAINPNGESIWLVLEEVEGTQIKVRLLGKMNDAQWISSNELSEWTDTITGKQGVFTWIYADPLTAVDAEETVHHHEHHPASVRSLWSRLLQLLRQDKKDLRTIILFALGVGIFSLSTPITVEAIVATVQGGASILLQPVIALSIVLLICLGFAAFFRVMQAFVVEYLQQRLFVRVVSDLAYRFPRVQTGAFDQQHGPELVNRFFDVLTVQKSGAVLLVDGVSVVIQTAIGLLVLAFYSPYLLGFDLVIIGAIAFIIFVLGRGAIRTSIDESYAKYHVAGWLEEMARHPQTFKHMGGAELAWNRADQLAREYVTARRSHFKIVFRQNLFALMLQALSSAALFALGGWLVIQRQLTLGQLVAAELLLTMVVGSYVKLGKSLESYYDLMAALDKLGHLLDLPLESPRREILPRSAKPASLKVQNLQFAYESRPNVKVFGSLTFSIEPGERVALIGPHGCGKSTLIDILFGLRDPSSGSLQIDGVDYRHLRRDSLRQHVSTAKGLEVFEGTVLANVRVGRWELTLPQVREALHKVRLYDEIMALPEGLETLLATGGAPLSYGQVRRLMKARAIAAQPRLLLIDEGLDSLPHDLREELLTELLSPDAPWTLLIATHDPEIQERCDRSIQMKK